MLWTANIAHRKSLHEFNFYRKNTCSCGIPTKKRIWRHTLYLCQKTVLNVQISIILCDYTGNTLLHFLLFNILRNFLHFCHENSCVFEFIVILYPDWSAPHTHVHNSAFPLMLPMHAVFVVLSRKQTFTCECCCYWAGVFEKYNKNCPMIF